MDLSHQPEMQQKNNNANRQKLFQNQCCRPSEDKFPQAAHEKPMRKTKFNAITPVLGD